MSDRSQIDEVPQRWRGLSWFKFIVWMIGFGVVFGIGFLIGGPFSNDSDLEPAKWRSAPVGYLTIGETVTATGYVKPSRLVEVGVQVSGLLEAVHVNVGDIVSKGDLIAEVDATIQRNQVAETEAFLLIEQNRLKSLRSALKLAVAEFDRQSQLHADGSTTEVDLERARDSRLQAELSIERMESQLDTWKARLTKEQTRLSYSTIYAPVAGTVLEVLATEGQTLTATYMTPRIMTIADLSRVSVEVKVSEFDVSMLTKGMGVRFTTRSSGTRVWRSSLKLVEPMGTRENNAVTYTATFEVDNNDGFLLPGMSTQVFFEVSDPKKILAVPIEMLSNIGASDSSGGTPAEVNVQTSDGNMQIRRVILGEFTHTHAEIMDGVQEGERVVAFE